MYVLGEYFDMVRKAVGEKSAPAVLAKEAFAKTQDVRLTKLIEKRNQLLQMVH